MQFSFVYAQNTVFVLAGGESTGTPDCCFHADS